MADEAQKTNDAQKPDEAKKSAAGGGGMLKIIIFAVVGLVAVMAITVGVLLLVGGDSTAEVPSEDSHAVGETASDKSTGSSDSPEKALTEEDSILALLEEDETAIEEIMANLEALDYEPTEADLPGEESAMSEEDSLEQVSWLETEKAALAKREEALEKREKELEALDLEVSKKLTTLEQAESNRIAQLARLYDSMDPRSVAKLAANLDDATVVAILPRMKPKNASQVLALLPAKRGARLSKQMITIAEN